MANVFDSWVNQKRRCIVAYGYLRESACVCGFRSKIPEILIAGFALGWGFFFQRFFELHTQSLESIWKAWRSAKVCGFPCTKELVFIWPRRINLDINFQSRRIIQNQFSKINSKHDNENFFIQIHSIFVIY